MEGRNYEEDMEKLEVAFFENLTRGNCEYGGIGLDDKRPFGNSSVAYDILYLLDFDFEADDDEDHVEAYDYANSLYDDLISWLREKYL